MIQANELRIGNYIQDKQFKNIGYLKHWISKNMVCVKKEFSTSTDHISEFEPIELTEELLLKCGFVKNDNCYNYYEFSLEPINEKEYFVILKYTLPIAWAKLNQLPISSLHQLQNVYFALTQTELQIKL